MLFFLRCFFRLEWGDGGGSSLGLELSTSAGPLAGEGERWRSVGGGEGGVLHPEVGWATWESQPYTLCPRERPARPVASAPVEER